MAEDIIRCDELTFEYGKNTANSSKEEGSPSSARAAIRALDHVSFDVRKGEFIAVIGKNGSGKTTLAKCLNALYTPTEGHVYINGWDTRDEQYLWNIRQTCGMVFQNPDNQLVSSIVEDDVAFGPENLGLPSELIRKRVDDALSAVGMTDSARRAPHTLPGGQKERIPIAGVRARKPQCIVFDEPTAMLDPKGRKEIMEIMEKLHDEGITIVLITHFMDEAVKADKIMVMSEGRIVKEGRPEDIFTDSELVRSFKTDLPVGVDLAIRLREKGLSIPEDVITEEQLADHLTSLREEISQHRERSSHGSESQKAEGR